MSETRSKCDACQIAFEPKTPIVSTKGDQFYQSRYYHHGCWAKINRAMIDPIKADLGPTEISFSRDPQLVRWIEDNAVSYKTLRG